MTEGDSKFHNQLQQALDNLGCDYDSLVEDEDNRFVVSKYRRYNGEYVLLKQLKTPDPYLRKLLSRESVVMNAIPESPRCRAPKIYSHGVDFILREFVEGRSVGMGVDLTDTECEILAAGIMEFQAQSIDSHYSNLMDRDSLRLYYLKRYIKHALHLLPNHISLGLAVKILWKLWKTLPTLTVYSVPSHGDFRLSNLLFSDDGIVMVDLEGFRIQNHPLYDVVSIMTADIRPFHQWSWQSKFIKHYLSLAPGIEWKRQEQIHKLLWILLVFFTIYRFNECRMHAMKVGYFDGEKKIGFALKRLLRCLKLKQRQSIMSEKENDMYNNLTRLLDRSESQRIITALISG